MAETKLTYSAHWLARDADCASPDKQDSPGAEFLLRIQDSVNYVDEESLANDHDDDLASELAHEMADSAVPVGTHEMWQVFVDLAAYQEDPTELGATSEDMNRCAGVCLYLIGHRLAVSLIEERKVELRGHVSNDGDGETT